MRLLDHRHLPARGRKCLGCSSVLLNLEVLLLLQLLRLLQLLLHLQLRLLRLLFHRVLLLLQLLHGWLWWQISRQIVASVHRHVVLLKVQELPTVPEQVG